MVDCNDRFGPRPRSEEHIIPQAVFGKVTTANLCKCCNDHFGSICDNALLKDQRMVDAAAKAGVPPNELWTRYQGIRRTASGRTMRTSYTSASGNERYRVQPQLDCLDQLAIAHVNGVIDERDLRNFRARLIQRVLRKGLPLTEAQIITEVDKLLRAVSEAPTEPHYNPVIDERLETEPLGDFDEIKEELSPWKTEWCLAKIIFELSQLLWPPDFREYCAPALEEIRSFLEKRECSEDGHRGIGGLFTNVKLPDEKAAMQHEVEGLLTPDQVRWTLRFFGTAQWEYVADLDAIHPPPDPGRRITLINPCGEESPDASIDVSCVTEPQ